MSSDKKRRARARAGQDIDDLKQRLMLMEQVAEVRRICGDELGRRLEIAHQALASISLMEQDSTSSSEEKVQAMARTARATIKECIL